MEYTVFPKTSTVNSIPELHPPQGPKRSTEETLVVSGTLPFSFRLRVSLSTLLPSYTSTLIPLTTEIFLDRQG